MTPSVLRTFGSRRRRILFMSKSLTMTFPESARTSPVMSFISVVLPEPEGPTRKTNSPSSIVMSTPSSATVPLLS